VPNPELENSEKEELHNKLEALYRYHDEFKELEIQKQRHDTEIIVGAAGFLTILSFTVHQIFLTGNFIFLWRLLDYNLNNKETLIDNQIKSFVMATIVTAIPFVATGFDLPNIIGLWEFVKTLVIT